MILPCKPFIKVFLYFLYFSVFFFFHRELQSSICIQINVPELIPIFLGATVISTKSSLCWNLLDVVRAVIYGPWNIALWPNFLECLVFNIYRVSFTNGIVFPSDIDYTNNINFSWQERIHSFAYEKKFLFLYKCYSFLDSVSMIIGYSRRRSSPNRLILRSATMIIWYLLLPLLHLRVSSTCVRLFSIALAVVSMPCSLLTSKCSDALHSTFNAHVT